jgi:hypothetical protein
MMAAWASGFFCLIAARAFWTCSDLNTSRQLICSRVRSIRRITPDHGTHGTHE